MPLEFETVSVPARNPAKTWRGIVRWRHDTSPTDDQFGDLVAALPGYGTAEYDAARHTLTARLTVDATTLRAAVDETLKSARHAHHAAFDAPGDPFDARVLTDDAWVDELQHPPQMQLVGIAEIAEILGVSTQRVGQLAEEHDRFPAPIGTLKAGRVYTRASVEAFAASDWRRKRGPKPKPAAST